MAEAIGQRWLDEQHAAGRTEDRDLATSAGVSAGQDVVVSPETLVALEQLGISFDGRSKPLSAEMIRQADLVLAMTRSHLRAAESMLDGEADAAHRAKLQPLDPSGDIEDPIGLGQEAYDDLARRFVELIPARLDELLDLSTSR
jgi:protein-tyrosine-phosphatase